MPEIMINKGIDAMLANLDPYTQYYPADKADELKDKAEAFIDKIEEKLEK